MKINMWPFKKKVDWHALVRDSEREVYEKTGISPCDGYAHYVRMCMIRDGTEFPCYDKERAYFEGLNNS